jgi:hypothetical protein
MIPWDRFTMNYEYVKITIPVFVMQRMHIYYEYKKEIALFYKLQEEVMTYQF